MTTIHLTIDVNGEVTIIAQQQIECQREFTTSSEIDLTSETKLTNGITANLAMMRLFSLGTSKLLEIIFWIYIIF